MAEVVSLPHDVVIIGAGPCGLAVAARLTEATPSALFTDAEHERFWGKRHNSSHRKTLNKSEDLTRQSPSTSRPVSRYSIAVLESHSNQWMSRWNNRFDALRISHLRSPMFFHVDPGDRNGLLAYAYAERRERELKEVRNVVGKELSKHHRKQRRSAGKKAAAPKIVPVNERDREDYFRPSQKLFCDHCQDVSRRYKVDNLIQQTEVTSVSYDHAEDDSGRSLFTIESTTGKFYSRTVIMAIGPGVPQCVPTSYEGDVFAACHTSYIMDGGELPAHLMKKIKSKAATNVVVIGGGLTSAQVTDLLIKKGVTKVWHLMRGPTKVRHFDLELPWVGKYKNNQLSTFWCCDDDDERLKMILESRNGGTLTPEHRKILETHCAHGRAKLFNYTEIASKTWDPATKTWLVKIKSTQLASKDEDAESDTSAEDATMEKESKTSQSKPPSATNKDVEISGLHSSEDANHSSMTDDTISGASDSATHPTRQGQIKSTEPPSDEDTLPSIDFIIYSTGNVADIDSMPLLEPLHRSHPIDTKGGLPCLTNDLMWRDDVPLFLTGRFAGLRLGPFAGNLEGARQGAERIAWKVEELLLPEDTVDSAPQGPKDLTAERFAKTTKQSNGNKMKKSKQTTAPSADATVTATTISAGGSGSGSMVADGSGQSHHDHSSSSSSSSDDSGHSSDGISDTTVSTSATALTTDHTDLDDKGGDDVDEDDDDDDQHTFSMHTKAKWYTQGVGSMYLALEDEA